MSEYIERETLLRTLSKEVEYNDDGDQEINSDTVFIAIESAPAADVETVRHGKWIDDFPNSEPGSHDGCEEWYGKVYTCSECGERIMYKNNCCPNCGAKMDKEDET